MKSANLLLFCVFLVSNEVCACRREVDGDQNQLEHTKETLQQCLTAINKKIPSLQTTLYGFIFRLDFGSAELKKGCRTIVNSDKTTCNCPNVVISAILSIYKIKGRPRFSVTKNVIAPKYMNVNMSFESAANSSWIYYRVTHFSARKPKDIQIEDFRFGTAHISAIELEQRLDFMLEYVSELTPMAC
ncbi:hypothetical protein SprV_0902769900 [Sparganum proliferum]